MKEQAQDASNEPLEVKLIAAASDGYVNVTPEKCERIRELLRRAAPSPGNREQALREALEKRWPGKGYETIRSQIFEVVSAALATQGEPWQWAGEDAPWKKARDKAKRQDAQAVELDARALGVQEGLRLAADYVRQHDNLGNIAAVEILALAGQPAQPLQREVPRTNEELIRGLVKATLELACLRNNLCYEDEPPMVVEQCAELVDDTFNALYGIGTCSEEPCDEVLALNNALSGAPVQPQVEELRALSEKATAGPWEQESRYFSAHVAGGRPNGEIIGSAHPSVGGIPEWLPREQQTANAAFIVACVNAVRKWLAPTEEGKL